MSSKHFNPKLDILPWAQKKLWKELAEVPEVFSLYGGTALALYLGHRQSVDFDFFGTESFNPDSLLNSIPFLEKAEVIQKTTNTLTVLVDRGEPVQVSFFGVPRLKRLRKASVVAENNLKVANLLDLAGTKAAVVQTRAEVKDYIDIDAMISANVVDLSHALSAARTIYGEQFNPELTLKALCYFDDVAILPEEVRRRLISSVQSVDLANLPVIKLDDK